MKRMLLTAVTLLVGVWAAAQVKDTTKVLLIGNSFTYYGNSHEKIAAIALSQGHKLDVRAEYVGGYTFSRHLRRDGTIKAIEIANPDSQYAFAFLQNQSQLHARYGSAPARYKYVLADAKELVGRIREYSPDAKIYLEQTWSFSKDGYGRFGSYENFDRLLKKGTCLLAKRTHAFCSPIGDAFAIAREECPEIKIYHKDGKHQGDYGAYLKACVNYLLIFREPFTEDADPCGLDPKSCAKLRSIAERVVLK